MDVLESIATEVKRQADTKLEEVIAMALELNEKRLLLDNSNWLFDEGGGP